MNYLAISLLFGVAHLCRGDAGWKGKFSRTTEERPVDIMTDVVNDLGVKILDCYTEHPGNVAFSPTGLAFVLAALYEGSAGRTSRQIAHALGLPRDRRITRIGLRDIHRRLRSYLNADAFLGGLSLSRDDITLRPEYEDTLRFYGFDVGGVVLANATDTATVQPADPNGANGDATTPAVPTVTPEAPAQPADQNGANGGATTPTAPMTMAPEAVTDTTGSTSTVVMVAVASPGTPNGPTTPQTAEVPTQPTIQNGGATTTAAPMTMPAEDVTDAAGSTSTVVMVAVPSPDIPNGPTTPAMDATINPEAETLAVNTENASGMSENIVNRVASTSYVSGNIVPTVNGTMSTTPMSTATQSNGTTPSSMAATIAASPATAPNTVPMSATPASTQSGSNSAVNSASTAGSGVASPNNATARSFNVNSTMSSDSRLASMMEMMAEIASSVNALISAGTTTSVTSITSSSSTVQGTTSAQTQATTAATTETTTTVDETGAPTDVNEVSETTVPPIIRNDENSVRKKRSSRPQRFLNYPEEGIWIDDVAGWQDDGTNGPGDDPRLVSEHTTELQFLVNGCDVSTISTATYTAALPFAYLPSLRAFGVEFPLDDPRYNVILLVPTEGSNNRVLARLLRGKTLRHIRAAMKPTWIKATIPSFMLRGFITITPYLQKLGMKDAFEPRASDLSPMSPDLGVYARDVQQSIGVNIRNYMNGANGSMLAMQTTRSTYQQPENLLHTREPIPFTVDRPFLFFIVDTYTSAALIAGRIDDPLNSRII